MLPVFRYSKDFLKVFTLLTLGAIFFFISICETSALAQERDIDKVTLSNGLKVIIEEDHSAPVVAIQMWVRVGSADEKEEEAGIAHVFEHMLFKGTAKRGPADIAKEIESSGGYINAYTSFDNTVYHTAVASRYFSRGLDIISDAIQHSAFVPSELEKELGVVQEELRMGEDSPDRKLYKAIFATAYDTHPYKRPVIGYKETVDALTRDYIIDFFKRWYIPGNMTLVVVGDVDKADALKEIEESFKDFLAAPDPHTERPKEPKQDGLKEITIRQPIKQTRIALAYHIPELKDKTTYAMDVITGILGEGVTSRLYKRLKVDEELVHTISTYAMTPKEPGLFLIEATLDSDNTRKAVEEILVEIGRLRVEGPSPRELEKTKLSLESEFIYKRETMRGKARQLGYYETISGDLKFEEKYIRGIRAVSSLDVKAALSEYLVTENLTFSMLLPESKDDPFKKGPLSKVVAKADKKIEKLLEKKLAFGKEKEAKKIRLDNAVTLIVKEDHSNPTVALYASFPGGLRAENMKTNGLGSFVATAFKRGTTNRSRNDLAREIEDMAGSISGFSSRNTSGMSATFLSRYFDRGLTVFADMLMNPAFEPEEVEKLRADILSSIKRKEDYLPGHTFKLLYSKLFNFHPYGMPVMGSAETVSSFTADDLRAHYDKVFLPKRMVLTVVGDINTEHVIERVKEVFEGFERKSTPLPKLNIEDPPQEIIRTGEKKDKEQTNIGIGFLGPRITDRDVYAMDVLTEILSAQGGRLFVELRDKKSLAYAVSAFMRPGIEPGTFAVYIGCAPDKKDEAVEGILYELKRITEEEVEDNELERAKSAILGQFEMGLQKVSSQASNMATNEVLGLGFDYQKRYTGRIERVSKKDILRAARRYITLDKGYVISIVGPNFKAEERHFPE